MYTRAELGLHITQFVYRNWPLWTAAAECPGHRTLWVSWKDLAAFYIENNLQNCVTMVQTNAENSLLHYTYQCVGRFSRRHVVVIAGRGNFPLSIAPTLLQHWVYSASIWKRPCQQPFPRMVILTVRNKPRIRKLQCPQINLHHVKIMIVKTLPWNITPVVLRCCIFFLDWRNEWQQCHENTFFMLKQFSSPSRKLFT